MHILQDRTEHLSCAMWGCEGNSMVNSSDRLQLSWLSAATDFAVCCNSAENHRLCNLRQDNCVGAVRNECIWVLIVLTFAAHEHAAHPASCRSMQAHLKCDMLCMMMHEALWYVFTKTGRVNSYSNFICQLSYTTTCQLRCILSARLHYVFGCDLSVDSQLLCNLSVVPVDWSDNCSQLGCSCQATSQLVCSAAAFIYVGQSVSAKLQCVSSSAICSQLACWQGSAGLDCQPASENIEQLFFVITWPLTCLSWLLTAADD